jgi:ParB family chromosome partitioning protein
MVRGPEKGGRFALPRIGQGPSEVPEASRKAGPMAVAGRESAEALTRLAEEQAEQRRRNAEDAEAFRKVKRAGDVLERLPLDVVQTRSLPRDRLDLATVARSDPMDELKASIRSRGQREAIEVWPVGNGIYELKTGWRRLEALRQLRAETGEARFATVLARVMPAGSEIRSLLYIDMVEENIIREDVSFAELAHVAIMMARDPMSGVANPDEAVNRLYGSVQKIKRSTIRRFVELLRAAGGALPVPQAIPKHLGAEAARLLGPIGEHAPRLRQLLDGAKDAAAQNAALETFIAERTAPPTPVPTESVAAEPARKGGTPGRQKFEFHHEGMKVTARPGEVRIRCAEDFVDMPRDRLEAAVAAFRAALRG